MTNKNQAGKVKEWAEALGWIAQQIEEKGAASENDIKIARYALNRLVESASNVR